LSREPGKLSDLAGKAGFEPTFRVPKALVLPLDDFPSVPVRENKTMPVTSWTCQESYFPDSANRTRNPVRDFMLRTEHEIS
jgi:hypothetical protein